MRAPRHQSETPPVLLNASRSLKTSPTLHAHSTPHPPTSGGAFSRYGEKKGRFGGRFGVGLGSLSHPSPSSPISHKPMTSPHLHDPDPLPPAPRILFSHQHPVPAHFQISNLKSQISNLKFQIQTLPIRLIKFPPFDRVFSHSYTPTLSAGLFLAANTVRKPTGACRNQHDGFEISSAQ